MKIFRYLFSVSLALVVTLALAEPGRAQFGKLKDKVGKKVEDKVEKKVDDQLEGKGSKDSAESKEARADTTEEASKKTGEASAAAPAGEEFKLYTKFDFVPGQKVLFYDDLSGEEMGEFPSRWKLAQGVVEIAKVGKDPWIMASTRSEVQPKLNINQLPERYTVEFEVLTRAKDYQSQWSIKFSWLKEDGNEVAHLEEFGSGPAWFAMADDKGNVQNVSDKQLPAGFEEGIHTFRIMVTKSSVKAYFDNERVVNAPRTAGFVPTTFQLGLWAIDEDFARSNMFFRNFRFAEGGKTMREQLDEDGHVAIHGIYFDVNSDKIKGESYKTLSDIAQLLTDDAALKLTIEGHTDSDGEDAFNMDLSQRRAESVRKYLTETYKIDGTRLQAKGYGETKPIDNNTSPEGKANNRRVELVKI